MSQNHIGFIRQFRLKIKVLKFLGNQRYIIDLKPAFSDNCISGTKNGWSKILFFHSFIKLNYALAKFHPRAIKYIVLSNLAICAKLTSTICVNFEEFG